MPIWARTKPSAGVALTLGPSGSRMSPRMGLNRLKILSGGQTGADRAALDWALAHGIPHGGWCPKGRLAEDGTIPLRYLLHETETADYKERTAKNVLYSHGTVIFSLSVGSLEAPA